MLVTTLGPLALGFSLMVAGRPQMPIQPVDLRISQVEPEEPPSPDPTPTVAPSAPTEEETYVDENGQVVTLGDIVSECTGTDDLACEGNGLVHFWSKPRSGHLAGFFDKFRSAWSFHKWSLRLRGHSFHRPLFARHASMASECECGDVCAESCCGDCGEDECGELATEEPVRSTAEPCPACMHVIAPAPATVTPVTDEPVKPAPVSASEDTPSLPTKEVDAEPSAEEPLNEESTQALPKRAIESDIPTKPIPTESTSLSVGLTEVVPTSFEDQGPHAEDFSWIVGELGYQHSRGGVWTVRYLPFDRTDANGGQVILSKDARLAQFKEGDMVRIEGRIAKRSNTSSPTYRITAISKTE
jgi:hypothetical protein